MTNFETALHAYRNANDAASMLSGDALNEALDTEANALFALAATPARSIGAVLKKLDVLRSLLKGDFSDGRDVMLLDSVRRDLCRLERKTGL